LLVTTSDRESERKSERESEKERESVYTHTHLPSLVLVLEFLANLLQGLGRRHSVGVHPAFHARTGRGLDDIGWVYSDVEASDESNTHRLREIACMHARAGKTERGRTVNMLSCVSVRV